MRIVFFESLKTERKYFTRCPLCKEHELLFTPDEIDGTDLGPYREAEVVSLFVYSRLNAEALEQLPNLRMVATRSTGFDHIDLDACRQRGIVVSNVPDYGENTVAEHTFALILCLSRKISLSHMRTMRNDFSQEGLEGFDLKGKTLGLIGCGRIGIRVVMIARGLGMKVVVYDPRPDSLRSELLNFEYLEMEEVLRRSDIVTLHAPHNEKTHHLINGERLALMKSGAILINTARGALVDTEAVLEALDTGRLGGLGLDVLEGEDLIKEEWQVLAHRKEFGEGMAKILLQNHLLMNRGDVIITPHNAFNSHEARMRIWETTVRNIHGFLADRPINVVTGP